MEITGGGRLWICRPRSGAGSRRGCESGRSA